MVRIIQYDPKITAEAYSRRQAEERPFESPVAEGLGRLGQALMARAERREPGHQDQTQAMAALTRMRKKEFARLKDHSVYRPQDPRWSAKGFLEGHLKRRDEEIAALARENPRAAQILAKNSATLTEDLSRRAMVTESGHAGDALVANLNAAVGDAIETVRTDPTQLGAVLSEIRATMAELAENGMDPNATATIGGAAERKITNAAFGQRLKNDPAAAKEELEAGEFGDGLSTEETEAAIAKADQTIKVQRLSAEADAKVTSGTYRANFNDYLRQLITGDVAEDEIFSEEAIRARVSPEDAEQFFIPSLRQAQRIADAFAEFGFKTTEQIEDTIQETNRNGTPDEVMAVRAALDLRNQLLDEDPAAFALRNGAVFRLHDGWMQARTIDDFEAAKRIGSDYARATLSLQRQMGVAESELRVLPGDMADAMVMNFTRPDGEGAFAWGVHFRTEFGENWRIALADVVRAGLPDTHADLAQMGRPDQRQAAAQIEAALATPNGLQREGGDTSAAVDEAIDTILQDVRGQAGTEPIGRKSSQANIARWRADQLVGIGMAPEAAARQALREISLTSGQYLWLAGPASETGPAQIESQANIVELASIYGFDPRAVLAGGDAVRDILLELDPAVTLRREDYDRLRALTLELNPSEPMRGQLIRAIDGIIGKEPSDDEQSSAVGSTPGLDGADSRSAIGREFHRLVDGLDPQERALWFRQGLAGLDIGWASVTRKDLGASIEFLNDALQGEDPMLGKFSVTAILRAQQEGHLIFKRLTEEARAGYIRLVVDEYHATAPIELGPRTPADARLVGLAERQRREYGFNVPPEISEEILLHLSRFPRASLEQRRAYVQFIHRVVTPQSSELAGRLLEAAEDMRVEPGTIARVPSTIANVRGGKLVVDPGGLGEIHGRYAPYFTNEDLVLAYMATGNDFPDLAVWPRDIPDDLLDTDFAISAGMAVVGVGRAVVNKPPGPWSAALVAAGIASSAEGIYDAIGENDQEHSDYLLSLELVRRFNDETFRHDFKTIWDIARDSLKGMNDPGPFDPAPSSKDQESDDR